MAVIDELEVDLETMGKLTKDVRSSAQLMDRDQARFIVGMYYQLQEHRIAMRNQERSLAGMDKPAVLVTHFADQFTVLEKQMVSILDGWTDAHDVGRWSKAQKGIGPVLAAGLLAHIDIEIANTAGKIWRFAGLDPTVKWEKGQRRPYNADLKVLCWKIGDSFVKVSGRDAAPGGLNYGHLYKQRKEQEVSKNEAGDFADQAAATLRDKNIQEPKTRAAYEAGRLPDGRIDMRARRWAVKLFLSHWQHVAYVAHYGMAPPKPYVIEHLGHVDFIPPPPGN